MYPHGSMPGYSDPAVQLAHLQAQLYAQQYAQSQAPAGPGVYGFGYGQATQAGGGGAAPMVATGAEGRVVHVSNINASVTSIAHLFNLFSLCGSIARIKFVYSNTSQALIEYVSAPQASLAVRALNKATLGGHSLVVAISKHNVVQVQHVDQGGNASLGQDFTGQRCHRARFGPDAPNSLPIPCTFLYITGIPLIYTEAQLAHEFSQFGGGDCISCSFVVPKTAEAQARANAVAKKCALLEFGTVAGATEVLARTHNMTMEDGNIRVHFSQGAMKERNPAAAAALLDAAASTNTSKRPRFEPVAEPAVPEVSAGCSLLQLPWLQTLVAEHACSTILQYTPLSQSPTSGVDPDKIIAGFVRTRVISEAVAFISGDKQSVYLVASVASAATGSSLATTLIAEACSAVLAAQSNSLSLPPTSTITITSSSPIQNATYVVIAKVTGDQRAHATLQIGAGADDAPQVICQGTLSHAS